MVVPLVLPPSIPNASLLGMLTVQDLRSLALMIQRTAKAY